MQSAEIRLTPPAWQSREWRRELIDCRHPCDTCCLGCCLPCVLYASNVESLSRDDQNHGRQFLNCCLYFSIPAAINGMALALTFLLADPLSASSQLFRHGSSCMASAALASFAAPSRRRLREQQGLPEQPCSDWCVFFWCAPCALCQEAAQLEDRYEGRIRGQLAPSTFRRLAAEPPAEQTML